jgi:hypothetical protein
LHIQLVEITFHDMCCAEPVGDRVTF